MSKYKEGDYVAVHGYDKVYIVNTATTDGFVATSIDGKNKLVAIYGRDTMRYASDDEIKSGWVDYG